VGVDAYLARFVRSEERAKLKRLRDAVRAARAHKRSARERAALACKRAQRSHKRWLARERKRLQELIAKLRERLKDKRERRRERVRACCGTDRQTVRERHDQIVAQARAELEALEAERRDIRLWTRKSSTKLAPASKRKERREESDHAVEVNLTPDELIVWREVKDTIHAGERQSRTEAFQHWMHDHSAEVGRILADDADRYYERAVREEARERARVEHGAVQRFGRAVSAQAMEVPF
jgi:hypothetical protein